MRRPENEAIHRTHRSRSGASSITVVRGDTVFAIARQTGRSPGDLISWNHLQSPERLVPGQRLRVVPPEPVPRPSKPVSAAGAPSAVATHASVPVRPPPAAPPLHDVVPETAGPPTWCWPTQGRVVSAFIAGDTTRQGIDIAGHDGQTVRAAAAGQVVYSGSGLVGYGELIIIKHTADWLSAYAHNRARLVQEGQQVRAGQKIAELGHSGTSQDLLHFEIRLHGKPVDPLQQLPRQH